MSNSINFGSVNIAHNNNVRLAIKSYMDCMDTARTISDSLQKIKNQTGNFAVEIRGKIKKDKSGDLITIESYNAKQSSLLSKISIQADDYVTSRAELFRKFCDDTIKKIKK